MVSIIASSGMDTTLAITIISTLWSFVTIFGLYLHFVYRGKITRELEEYRQMQISQRQMSRPKEWWQEVIVELAKHPEILSKVIGIIPQGILQNVAGQKLSDLIRS